MHYTKQNNKYYKITKKSKKQVCKKMYYSYIKRKLMKSIYPTQYRDFSFIRIPKHFKSRFCKNAAGKYVPVDYLLKNIVLFLWKNEIETYGWDQSRPDAKKSFGFISFESKNENKEKIFKMLGEKNISNKHYKNKICFEDFGHFMSISFHHNMIQWIHNKLQIIMPEYDSVYAGNLIEFRYKDDGKRVYFTSKKYNDLIKK